MTSLPHLEKIRLRWKDHRAAWGWVMVMYRNPKFFERLSDRIPRWRSTRTLGIFSVHLLPWVFVVSFIFLFTSRNVTAAADGIPEIARWALWKASVCIAFGLAVVPLGL